MAFTLPPLPYDKSALAPHISAETLEYHHGKHHNAYVTNLNKLLEGKPEEKKSLEDIILSSEAGVFNNSAQIWNHTFYWNSMQPNGGGPPTGVIADRVKDSFGDYTRFRQEFATAAITQLGSGWIWLAQGPGKKLVILKTANVDTPIVRGTTCLLTCDVWEHAYYLDYQNKRLDYVNAWLDKLTNWEFASQRLAS